MKQLTGTTGTRQCWQNHTDGKTHKGQAAAISANTTRHIGGALPLLNLQSEHFNTVSRHVEYTEAQVLACRSFRLQA